MTSQSIQPYQSFRRLSHDSSAVNVNSFDFQLEKTTVMPKIVWIFYNDIVSNAPYTVRMTIRSWKHHNPQWDIIILSHDKISNYVDPKVIFKESMSSHDKSAMLRLALLSKYGGVYVDPSVLCMEPLDSWVWDTITPKGYWMYNCKTCSWFIMAASQSNIASKSFESAMEYWSSKDQSSGSGSDKHWIHNVLTNPMPSDPTSKNEYDSTMLLSGDGQCSPQLFSESICEFEPTETVSSTIRDCLDNNPPHVIKLHAQSKCQRLAITEPFKTQFQSNGHYALFLSLGTLNSISTPISITTTQALDALKLMGSIKANLKKTCETNSYGKKWGEHVLCKVKAIKKPCYALTYGISTDYQFEIDLQTKLGCTVFGLDPTINHKAELHPNVYFIKFGAPANIQTKEESKLLAENERNNELWTIASPVQLAKLVAPKSRISVLKMDCEGCEYSIYKDIMKHDPYFFEKVDQFAIEVHLSKQWMRSDYELIQYGKLLHMLFTFGFKLQHVMTTHCAPVHEGTGLLKSLTDTGYYSNTGHCENFLFAREGI